MTLKQQLRTVLIFTKLSTKRFFRDKLALFFGVLFPLIFLFVFGSMSKGNTDTNFRVAIFNQSKETYAAQFNKQLTSSKTFKVSKDAKNLADAKDKMAKSQLDGIIVLPEQFGAVNPDIKHPQGVVQVLYSQSNANTGQTLIAVLNGMVSQMNAHLLGAQPPLAVQPAPVNDHHLTAFDYTFAGLLGFSIIGIGIFGPINVFPELKKQGILRRLGIAAQFAVAIGVFKLQVVGNWFEIIIFTVLGIFMILGIGLAVGGWAKNERQAAPLANAVVFPMMFLSGTFFPRFLMPGWLQSLSDWLPLTPVIDGLRLLTTEGAHLVNLGHQLALIGGWMLLIYVIAFRVFRWE